jgi:hypothetical protein
MSTSHEDEPGEVMTAPFTQEVKPMLKSEALVPVTTGVFVMVTELPVPLVRNALMGDVNPPRGVDGNVTGLGENATVVLPLPVRLMVIGLPDGPVNGI